VSRLFPVAAGSVGMICVGGSVAVSGLLSDAPLFTTQAARYAVACLLLIAFARLSRVRLVRPRGTEWFWLAGIAATGMVVFNLALVQGAKHAEPAVLGVAVACVPLVLAAAGPAYQGRGPRRPVLAGAFLVTVGATLVQGLGRTDGIGLAWAAVTFGCEAAFTLLAVPVLGRHGPVRVSVHTTWLAAAMLAVLGPLHEGPAAITRLSGTDLLAGAYLAVAVTAVAFVLWYACVSRLGAGRGTADRHRPDRGGAGRGGARRPHAAAAGLGGHRGGVGRAGDRPASLCRSRRGGLAQASSDGIRSNNCVVYVTISCNIQLPENKIAAPTPTAFGTNDSVAS